MRARLFAVAVLLGVPLLPLPAAAADSSPRPPEVVPADGQPFAATLVTVEGDSFTFATDAGQRTLKAGELVRWGHLAEATRGAQVVLADGSLLIGDVLRIADEQCVLLTDLFDEVHLPLAQVRGIIFQPPGDRAVRDKLLARIRGATEPVDRLLLVNGDELTGTVLGLVEDQIEFDAQVGRIKIEVVRAALGGDGKGAAMLFNPALAAAPPGADEQRVLAGFKDGSLVAAASLQYLPTSVRLKTCGGTSLETTSLADLVALQPLGFGMAYLSDRKPHSYQHVPYLSLAWDYQTDRSTGGSRLRAAQQLYAKGLGMHSAARLTYLVPDGYRRFAADVAIDDEAGNKGSVVFRVYLYDGSQWKQAAASPIVRGGDPPVPVSVDLVGAKAISLLVDFADHGDELDHADWLDARLAP